MAAEDTDHELDRLDARVNDTARSTVERLRSGQHVTGRATALDGSVTVVVTPGGMLYDVVIDKDAMRGSPDALADEIVRLAGKATRNAGAGVHESLRGLLDGPTTASLVELGVADTVATDDGPEDDGVLRRVR